MRQPLQLSGHKFGRLTPLKPLGANKDKKIVWECVCDCGNIVLVVGKSLKNGNTRSCGCLKLESVGVAHKSHGLSKSRFYSIYLNIKQRTSNPNKPDYKYYGGRGIRCRWMEFGSFKNDMYKSYLGHVTQFGEVNTTIERVDNDGDYSKENCRWATRSEQGYNQRSNHLLSFKGKRMSLTSWSKVTGISVQTLSSRIRRGWSDDRVLGTPLRKFNWH